MIYRKTIGDMTIEYEGTSEEIRGVLDREDKSEGVKIIGELDIKDTSTNELIEELSKRTGVSVVRSKNNGIEEEEYRLRVPISETIG